MKKAAILITIIVAVALIGSVAMAVPPGKDAEFAGGPMGKVIFTGKIHSDAGAKCMDCHPKLFKMQKGQFKMKAPHTEFCGICHNGEKAPKECGKCHKK